MSEQKLLDQFDISLGEEVLNDVRTSGKSFKKEIWESGIGGGLLGCIFLDKSEQDVLRVQVKVFNSGETSKLSAADTQESASQAVQITEEKRQQTDVEQQENQSSQTDVHKQAEKTSQTPMAKLQETPMQTDVKQMAEKLSQTKTKQFSDMTMQTEPAKTQQRAMQVDPARGVGISSQTDPKPLSHCEVQTDPKPLSEAFMQTDPPPIAEKGVLAVCNMTHMVVQTQYMGIEKQVQAEPSLSEANIQTDIKVFKSIDIQAKPEIKDRNLQTSREFLRDVDCATDPMIIIDPENQCENDCQTDPMRVIDPQTDREAVVQTDDVKIIYPQTMFDNVTETDFVRCLDPNIEVENCVQTDDVHIRNDDQLVENIAQTEDVRVGPVIELAEVETQTTLVWVCGLQQAEEEEDQVNREISASQTVADVEIPLSQDSEVQFDSSQGTSGNSQQSPFQTPEKGNLSQDVDGLTPDNEKYCQTDPVTIIIGDSSFLVNRLKDYASPPRGAMGGIRTRGVRRRGGPMTRGGPMMRGGMTQRNIEDETPPKLTQEGGYGAGDGEQDMPILQNEDSRQRSAGSQSAPVNRSRSEGTYSGVRHRQLERADLIPASKSGRFNCPFCNLTFNESALLYRHLQLTHGTPRASNRRARRRGTIILLEDGRKIVENGNPRRQSRGRRGRRSAAAIPPDEEELYQETEKYTVLQEPDYEEEPMPGEEYVEEGEMLEHEEHEGEVTTVHIQQGDDGEVTTLQVLEGDMTEDGQVVVRTTEIHEEGEVLVQEQVAQQIEHEQHHEVVHQEVVQEQETETVNGPEVSASQDALDAANAARRAFSCPFCPKNFTKSSALYVHLQNSHKGEKQRIRMPRGSKIKYPATGQEQYVLEQDAEQEVEEGEVDPEDVVEEEVEQEEVEPGEVEPGEVEPGEVVLGEVEEGEEESEDEWPEREAELKEEKVKLEKDDDDTPRRGRGRPPKRKNGTPQQGEDSTSPKRTRRSVEVSAERRSLRKK